MPNEEWKRLQEALRRGDREAAAEAFRRYLQAKKAEGKGGGSKPTIVRLKTGLGWHSVPLENIPKQLEEDPEFFESMKEIAGK